MAGLLATQPQKKPGLLARRATPGPSFDIGTLQPASFAMRGSTQAVPDETTPSTVDLIKEAGQGVAREFGAHGQIAVNQLNRLVGLPQTPLTPTDKISQAIYGTDQPITRQSVGEEVPFVPKGSAWAPVIATASFLSNAIPGGSSALKTFARRAAASQSAEEIAGFAKGAFKGLDDAAARQLGERFASITDAKAILTELEDAISASKNRPMTKVAQGVAEVTKTPESVERGFITSAKEVLPDAEKIAGQYIPRSTDVLSMKAANFIKDDFAAATRLALEGTDDAAVATASELLKHYAKLARETTDVASKNAFYDQAADIANTLAPKLTEQGRAIQAASLLGRLTPEGQVRFAAKEIIKWNSANPTKKVPELTGEQAGKILDEMEEISKMSEGDGKAIRFQKLQDETRALIPSRWWDKLVNIWKAGLLTGIKTSGLNILASAAHTGLEIIKDVPAAGIDVLFSLLTGKRTVTVSTKGTVEGMKTGFQKGWQYLKTGYDSRNIAKKLDYTRVRFKHKAFQTYVDGIFRILGAEDQPFYYGALQRSLYNQARVAAKNKGLRGGEADAFIKSLVESPTDEMGVYALADAETAVFQNRTALGMAASAIVKAVPGAGFVIPFARTPSSVAMQVINYSPVGQIAEIVRQISKGKFDQRALSQAFGRSVVGSIPIFIGIKLFDHDLISLDFPDTERERESWKAEGRKANSIKVGDKWRTVQVFGPAGPLLLMGGHFRRALAEDGSQTGAMIKAVFGTLKSFTEQTFLKGTNDVMNAIMDPERNAEYVASSFISSWIPTIINDVARSTDPKERRAESIWQRVKSRLPILRQGLEPQVDILGQEQEMTGNPLEVMFDPTRPSPDTSTPVTEELKRLDISPTMLGTKKGYSVLSQEENTKLWKLTGNIIHDKLTTLLTRETYQKLSDENKSKVVTKIIDTAKLNARVAAVIKETQGLTREELKKRLIELKEGDLLNTQVFKKWMEYSGGKTLPAEEAPQANADTGGIASKVLGALTGARTAEAVGSEQMKGAVVPDKVLQAFKHNETGIIAPEKRYAFSQPSGDKALGLALGAYQVTEYFLKKYSKRYLGRTVTAKEFLANPQLQDDFMRNRIVYLRKQGYTLAQIADIHRHGSTNEPGSAKYKRPEYVKKFSTFLNG